MNDEFAYGKFLFQFWFQFITESTCGMSFESNQRVRQHIWSRSGEGKGGGEFANNFFNNVLKGGLSTVLLSTKSVVHGAERRKGRVSKKKHTNEKRSRNM